MGGGGRRGSVEEGMGGGGVVASWGVCLKKLTIQNYKLTKSQAKSHLPVLNWKVNSSDVHRQILNF